MSQSRKGSLVETLVNTGVGYVVACTAQALLFPYFGIHVPLSENLLMGVFFTVISIARSYLLRRLFNFFGRNKQCGSTLSSRSLTSPCSSCFCASSP